MKKFFTAENWLSWLLIFLPVAAFLEFTHAAPVAIFVTSCLAIIPLAGLMGKATEHLAEKMGAGIGGLLNATFGNAAELIIAALALHKGLHGVVKASITGSIIGNILLVLGLSILAGGVKYTQQRFNRTAAGLGSTLLALSVVALLGLTEVFVGVIVVAIIGNAADSTAILMAMKNKMDLAINIAVGSSIQVALFVAPVLVFLSYAFGNPMDLRFTPFEVMAVAMAVGVVAQDGESHWMEGVLLLAVYLVIGIAFNFIPA